MAKFASAFGINLAQAELDFVDVDTSIDNRLYLDPYAIQIRGDEWSAKCGDYIRSFFSEVLDQLRQGNLPRVAHLLVKPPRTERDLFGSLERGTGWARDRRKKGGRLG